MPAPDRFQQLVPADHALAMAHQIFQKIEHLRLDGAQRLPAAQLPALGVENTIVEPVDHGLSPADGESDPASTIAGIRLNPKQILKPS